MNWNAIKPKDEIFWMNSVEKIYDLGWEHWTGRLEQNIFVCMDKVWGGAKWDVCVVWSSHPNIITPLTKPMSPVQKSSIQNRYSSFNHRQSNVPDFLRFNLWVNLISEAELFMMMDNEKRYFDTNKKHCYCEYYLVFVWSDVSMFSQFIKIYPSLWHRFSG